MSIDFELTEAESDFVKLYKGEIDALRFPISGIYEWGTYVMTSAECIKFVHELAIEQEVRLLDALIFVREIDDDFNKDWVRNSKALKTWVSARSPESYFYKAIEVTCD